MPISIGSTHAISNAWSLVALKRLTIMILYTLINYITETNMQTSTINTNIGVTLSSSPRKILVVTNDLPSHPYAAAKLAKVLAKANHNVTLASPKGPAYDRIVCETRNCSNVVCKEIGTVTLTEKHFNERPVVDPMSYKALFQALWNPFPLAQACVENLFDRQEGVYLPLTQEITREKYDLIIPIHSASITVCDAVEAASPNTPVIIFSSLPYDPAIYLKGMEGWNMPRSLTTFPHVAKYSSTRPKHVLQVVVQLFWKWLDILLTNRAWARSATYNNARRAKRNLPPMPNGLRGYWQKYPVLSLGGVAPFLDCTNSAVASNVTVVGTLEGTTTPNVSGDLKQWLDKHACNGIAYAGFGTGTVLSDKEVAAVTGGLVHYKNGSLPPILFALRASEQQRLRAVIDKAVGSSPTFESVTHLEYLNGRLRIQANVPQAALLKSGRVKVFISHMGMGGFVEGAQGGVPFVAYPSGCDQWFNAQRAVDAGIAVQAPFGMDGLGSIVAEVLRDNTMQSLACSASKALEDVHGEERALELVEKVARKPAKDCSRITKRRNTLDSSVVLRKIQEKESPLEKGPIFTERALDEECCIMALKRQDTPVASPSFRRSSQNLSLVVRTTSCSVRRSSCA
jgi:hypothetical protein